MEKKHKIYAAIGVIAVAGIAAFIWHKNKSKKVVAVAPPAKPATPATAPAKTAGADGEDEYGAAGHFGYGAAGHFGYGADAEDENGVDAVATTPSEKKSGCECESHKKKKHGQKKHDGGSMRPNFGYSANASHYGAEGEDDYGADATASSMPSSPTEKKEGCECESHKGKKHHGGKKQQGKNNEKHHHGKKHLGQSQDLDLIVSGADAEDITYGMVAATRMPRPAPRFEKIEGDGEETYGLNTERSGMYPGMGTKRFDKTYGFASQEEKSVGRKTGAANRLIPNPTASRPNTNGNCFDKNGNLVPCLVKW